MRYISCFPRKDSLTKKFVLIGFDEQHQAQVEGDPMIYIVTMLLVFSAGIASLMIIYMKKEQVAH